MSFNPPPGTTYSPEDYAAAFGKSCPECKHEWQMHDRQAGGGGCQEPDAWNMCGCTVLIPGMPLLSPLGHKVVHIDFLNIDVDEQVVDLIVEFNSNGVATLGSCQGTPGKEKGYVSFHLTEEPFNHQKMTAIVFGFIFPLTKDLYDDVQVQVTASIMGFTGWVFFSNKIIPDLVKILRDF